MHSRNNLLHDLEERPAQPTRQRVLQQPQSGQVFQERAQHGSIWDNVLLLSLRGPRLRQKTPCNMAAGLQVRASLPRKQTSARGLKRYVADATTQTDNAPAAPAALDKKPRLQCEVGSQTLAWTQTSACSSAARTSPTEVEVAALRQELAQAEERNARLSRRLAIVEDTRDWMAALRLSGQEPGSEIARRVGQA